MRTNELNIVPPEEAISRLMHLIGQPTRVQILMAIGNGEACVCHLEAALGMRQACISQHLIVLRESNLVSMRRVGRNIFYCLTQPQVLAVIDQVGVLAGIPAGTYKALYQRPILHCPCPQCRTESASEKDV